MAGLRPAWHVVDAKGQVVGRLANHISRVLQGKHKPTFARNTECGDFVVVVNAGEALFTGRKETQKVYYWHTGYPGGLKQRTAAQMRAHKPEELIRQAVSGMLPKNRMRKGMMRRLRIFAGEEHTHAAQLEGFRPSSTQAVLRRAPVAEAEL